MTNPIIVEHNVETDEVIKREMNADELAQWQLDKQNALAIAKAEADKAAEKAALLAQLGINEDQAKLLLG